MRKTNRESNITDDPQSVGREAASKRRLSKSGQLTGIALTRIIKNTDKDR